MNRKGFTLAELIGVVIVMGLIILVIVTPILSQIKNFCLKRYTTSNYFQLNGALLSIFLYLRIIDFFCKI